MKTHEFGKSDTVLIQPVGKHELPWIENEVREIHRLTSADFKYIAVEIDDWNDDLSPWKAQAVFKDDDFGGGAVKTLEKILTLCSDKKKYYIGGYSLAGLFSLWAAYQTDIFTGIAAVSPSVWFPGFIDYMR